MSCCRSLAQAFLRCGAGTSSLAPARHSRSPLFSIPCPSAPAHPSAPGKQMLRTAAPRRRHRRLPHARSSRGSSVRLVVVGRELGGCWGVPAPSSASQRAPSSSTLLARDWAVPKLPSNNTFRGLLAAKVCLLHRWLHSFHPGISFQVRFTVALVCGAEPCPSSKPPGSDFTPLP